MVNVTKMRLTRKHFNNAFPKVTHGIAVDENHVLLFVQLPKKEIKVIAKRDGGYLVFSVGKFTYKVKEVFQGAGGD